MVSTEEVLKCQLHYHVSIQNLSLHLGQTKNRFQALDRVNFEIQPGEFICLLLHLVAENPHY